jgi:hypothetical protein
MINASNLTDEEFIREVKMAFPSLSFEYPMAELLRRFEKLIDECPK